MNPTSWPLPVCGLSICCLTLACLNSEKTTNKTNKQQMFEKSGCRWKTGRRAWMIDGAVDGKALKGKLTSGLAPSAWCLLCLWEHRNINPSLQMRLELPHRVRGDSVLFLPGRAAWSQTCTQDCWDGKSYSVPHVETRSWRSACCLSVDTCKSFSISPSLLHISPSSRHSLRMKLSSCICSISLQRCVLKVGWRAII